jgi:hypothetical protein
MRNRGARQATSGSAHSPAAVKRRVRLAAQNGYDSMQLIQAEQQAAHIRKAIDEDLADSAECGEMDGAWQGRRQGIAAWSGTAFSNGP